MASGLPVLGSDLGALPELIGRDAVLGPDAVDTWAQAIAELWSDPVERERRGTENLATARSRFAEDGYHDALMRVYAGSDTIA
jgi:glycosyltransferase involved in cell wall biosynthesis